MYRFFLIFALFVSTQLIGQTKNYLVHVHNSFNGKNQLIISAHDTFFFNQEITCELSENATIEYEIRGAPIILGKASYSAFEADNQKLINYYHNLVFNEVSPDYTLIYYEIESESGVAKTVTFYYYETYFSGSLPDNLMLSDGYYNLSIISNNAVLTSIPIFIQANTIIQLSN